MTKEIQDEQSIRNAASDLNTIVEVALDTGLSGDDIRSADKDSSKNEQEEISRLQGE